MVEVSQDMVGLEHASAELDRMMAEQSGSSGEGSQAGQTNQSANSGQRAAQAGDGGQVEKAADSISKDGTPAATDPKDGDAQQQQQQQQNSKSSKNDEGDSSKGTSASKEASEAGKALSKFARDKERRERSWAELNREKEQLRAEREAAAREKAEIEKQREEFKANQAQEEAKYKPEQYEAAAKKFEEAGKFDLAELARARAEELRKNPPPSPQAAEVQRAQQEQHERAMKEWWGKAAVDYPKVAQKGTAENTALESFLQAEPEAVRSPKGMYYAARLISAESVSARVPEMEKELGALRAKVKELEALTAPGNGDVPVNSNRNPGPPSEESQWADLERLASEMGPLR